jgi:hypothetical protein
MYTRSTKAKTIATFLRIDVAAYKLVIALLVLTIKAVPWSVSEERQIKRLKFLLDTG